jgi:hypothetical protein
LRALSTEEADASIGDEKENVEGAVARGTASASCATRTAEEEKPSRRPAGTLMCQSLPLPPTAYSHTAARVHH